MICKRAPYPASTSRRAFTLIELLVVIAIIAILAAILFPVFAQAKLAAKKAAGLSNMKQVATGLHLYLGDADDTMPLQTEGDVYNFGDVTFRADGTEITNYLRGLIPYIKTREIFKSPAVTDTYADFPPTKTSDTSYLGNHAVLSTAVKSKSATVFDDPAGLIYLQEFRQRFHLAELRPLCNYSISPSRCQYWHYPINGELYSNNYGDTRRNEGGGHMSFIDGHAKFRRGKSLKAKEFGLATYSTTGTPTTPSEDTWSSNPETWYTPMY